MRITDQLMALTPLFLVLILVIIVMMGIFTYLFTGRMRAYLDLIVVIDLSLFAIFALVVFLADNELLLTVLISGILVVMFFFVAFRFRSIVSGPYRDMMGTTNRILENKDFTLKSRVDLTTQGELRKLHKNVINIVEQISATLNRVKRDQDQKLSIYLNMQDRASLLTTEVNENTSDVDKILQSAAVISERIDGIRGTSLAFIDQLNTDFSRLAEIVKSADRIADQTNIVAVNASIEAINTDTNSDFLTVAEGIQRLSTRSRENTDLLFTEVSSIRRDVVNQIERLSTDLDQLEELIFELGEVSNRSSSYTHQQLMYSQDLKKDVEEILKLNTQISNYLEEFKLR